MLKRTLQTVKITSRDIKMSSIGLKKISSSQRSNIQTPDGQVVYYFILILKVKLLLSLLKNHNHGYHCHTL